MMTESVLLPDPGGKLLRLPHHSAQTLLGVDKGFEAEAEDWTKGAICVERMMS